MPRNPKLRLALASALLAALAGACDCGGGDALDTFAPELRVAPLEVDFGAWPVGARSLREITLINDGNAPVELEGAPSVQGPAAAGFALEAAGEDAGDVFPLEGGGIGTLTVRFEPREEASFEGVLVLPCAPPVGRVEIPLFGEGVPADVVLAPEVVDFGDVAAGESASAVVTLTSRSDADLTVPLVIEGAGFLIGGATTKTVTLPAGGSEELTLTFLPGRGGPFAARLVAELCGSGCGPSASLVGEGLAPRIEITPRPLDLGEVPVGEEVTGTLTLANVGVGTLTVAALAVQGDDGVALASAPALPLLLEGGEEAEVTVRYTATTPAAAVSASLVVESNDPLSPRVNVPVFAETPGAALRVVPAAAHFGQLDDGVTRDLDVVALASGTAPVTLTSVSIGGEGAEAFALLTPLPTLPFVMTPGESLLLTVRAAPDADAVAAGGATATLRFETDEAPDVESALTFASGTEGCQPRARPSSVNLGAVRVGLGASGLLTIENVGTGPCTFQSLGPAPGMAFDAGFSWTTNDLDVLAPGERGTIQVGYVASSAGTSSAYFALAFVEQPAPLFLSTTAWAVLGSLVAEPPSVVFGPNAVGCPARPGVVVYVNDGAGPVTVTEVRLEPASAAFDVSALSPPFTIPAGGAFEVGVTPHTAAAGTFLGQVVAVSDESGEVAASMTSLVEPEGAPVTERFLVEDAAPMVDVLFIVDDSGSMYDDQQVLAENFATFIAEAESAGGVDFHIGVTTTDVISPGAAKGALVGSPKVLTNNTPNLSLLFAERALVGIDGAGLELGLEAMRLALSEPTLSSVNAGFYRPDAALSVIVVTDEDDSGDWPDLAEYYPEGARSVDGYVSFLSALKGGSVSNAPVLFSAVSHYAPRYQALVNAFGGVQLDLASDWGTQLGLIGQATFGLGRTFRLAAQPDPGTVTVTVDGVVVTAFTVDVASSTVILDDTPAPGAEVEITYEADCS